MALDYVMVDVATVVIGSVIMALVSIVSALDNDFSIQISLHDGPALHIQCHKYILVHCLCLHNNHDCIQYDQTLKFITIKESYI